MGEELKTLRIAREGMSPRTLMIIAQISVGAEWKNGISWDYVQFLTVFYPRVKKASSFGDVHDRLSAVHSDWWREERVKTIILSFYD